MFEAWRMHLTNDALVRTRGFNPRTVPLQDVAGVGLLCKLSLRGSGWYVFYWPRSGDAEGVCFCVSNIKTASGRWVIKGYDYVPPLDWSRVAKSRAGRIATRVYEAAMVAQGAAGPLAQRRQREAVLSRATQTVGVWSPDGYMRNVDGDTVGSAAVER